MAGYRATLPSSGRNHPNTLQYVVKTLDGTGTTTSVTYADEKMYDMAETDYVAVATALGAEATPIQVTTRTATGCTLTHGNNSSVNVGLIVIGKARVKH